MKNLLLACTVLGLGLTACSPSNSGGGGGGGGSFAPQSVAGPAIEGTWESDCLRNPLGAYRMFHLEVTGNNFEHVERDFSDSSCRNQNRSATDLKGTYSFTQNLGGNVYRIEYRIPTSNSNITAIREQNLSLQGDALKVSEFIGGFGDEAQAPTGITLHRISAPPAAANPAPAPAPQGALAGGLYHSDAPNACDLSVSVMAVNGKTGAVYADFLPPCSRQSFEFDCVGNQCALNGSDIMSVTLLDSRSFKLNVPSANQTAVYRLK